MMRARGTPGGSPHNPLGLWDLGLSLLCLLDTCLDEHLIELAQDFHFRPLQGELFLDLRICRTTFDRVYTLGFELQGACQHQEPVGTDRFWCVECHILELVNADVVDGAVLQPFLDVFCRFQEVGRVTFLQWVFDVQC